MEDLPLECISDHWAKYCEPVLAPPLPPSPTTIPATCYPTIVTEIERDLPPAPTSPGVTPKCSHWRVAVSAKGCPAMVEAAKITMTQLVRWNPSLSYGCSGMIVGMAYCVAIS
ncbi:hypothetical protein TWF730_008089 [Orbilia blumenaviensis]|uniref:LysM domain-containing protein n=1 Tax=Orbilia blumenaviensis TaxID=1796055 RepID=A0AAV9V9R9_9PEZI